jgi:DNA-binding NtrC family response regulator
MKPRGWDVALSTAPSEVPVSPKNILDVLIIDDDPLTVEVIKASLAGQGFNLYSAGDAASGIDLVSRRRPAIVLLDLVLPGVVGMEMLDRILAIDSSIDVILVTGYYSTDSAVEAIQKGAYDYMTKPFPMGRLRQKLAKWQSDFRTRQRAADLDSELLQTFQFEGIVGRSPRMLEMFSKIRRVAPHFLTALVTGETGTGKESVAKALHHLSPFSSGPFVVCNCAAIPHDLIDSELFGHVKGSFTGAAQHNQGFVESASGGTLFLDEITEIPLGAQAKLLRLLQNREIQRVGASQPKKIDLRIVAATNRNLRTLVAENKLREDLFYRLSMVEIKLPRLADRREDLSLLQSHFLTQFSALYGKPSLKLTLAAQAAIAAYDWPGNVRELENVIGYCAMVAERELIDAEDLPEEIVNSAAAVGTNPSPKLHQGERLLSLTDAELLHIRRVVEDVGGNRAQAAAILKIGRTTLYRLLAHDKAESHSRSTSSSRFRSATGL